MAKTNLIDYEKLDELVKKYEATFDLDLDEEKLFLDILQDRRLNKYQDMRMRDSVNNMPLRGLFKKLTKMQGKEDEE